MSLVQIAYQTLLSKFRDWNRLEGREQMEVLHQASNLFGEGFRSALNLIEKAPERLQLFEYDHFYLVQVNLERCLLFKSSSKARLNDCTCKASWLRKVGEKAPHMCFHQIVLELALYLFPGKLTIERVDCTGTAELAEYLQAIE